MGRRKSLLIGINYTGSSHELQGCQQDVQNMTNFLISRGYPSDPYNMVVLTDARQGPFYPSGANILAAMAWLVSEPNCMLFLHYSGHGGQIRDPTGDRASGFDDTIVPVDFERNGQIDSDTLHRHLVSAEQDSLAQYPARRLAGRHDRRRLVPFNSGWILYEQGERRKTASRGRIIFLPRVKAYGGGFSAGRTWRGGIRGRLEIGTQACFHVLRMQG